MKTEKFCPGCHETKSEEDFYKIRGKYLSTMCKPCDIKKAAEYGKANPERRKAYRAKHRERYAGTMEYRARQIHEGMVERSRRRGWARPEFTRQDVENAVRDGVCIKTGIPFDFSIFDNHQNPWTPVPDRIDSSKPYTRDNVQWTCNMYNRMKSDWTDEEVLIMLQAYVRQNPGAF